MMVQPSNTRYNIELMTSHEDQSTMTKALRGYMYYSTTDTMIRAQTDRILPTGASPDAPQTFERAFRGPAKPHHVVTLIARRVDVLQYYWPTEYCTSMVGR
jgi:hypothetical protein